MMVSTQPFSNKTPNNYNPAPSPADQAEEALMIVLDTGAQELNQPLARVLHLTEKLLAQADPASPQAADLKTIVQETRRMHEIVRGLKLLARYNSLLSKFSGGNR
jgi:signal transduction histidine kinase